MQRRCDGTDDNLIRYPHNKKDDNLSECPTAVTVGGNGLQCQCPTKPCDCGKVFDDVYHRVIYPHESF